MSRRQRRPALVGLGVLSVLTGVVVFLFATEFFPHHSSNHDEGVYLQQAALLLDGQLWFHSPVPDAVRPWFFVQDGSRLYPKYSPVPAAVFALGVLVDVPRLSLALVAAANTALVGLVTTEAFDERTGLLAAGLFVASPLFLVQSALFLPYAPTTMFNLAFALAYLRACRGETRRSRRRYSALAGAAIGIAFFARPYTAVLFALPFMAHALVTIGVAWRRDSTDPQWFGVDRSVVERYTLIGTLGLVFVGVALLYNAVVTGSPLVFPYQRFAPMDGPGFGVRRILGYERNYTPELALRANRLVLQRLLGHWTAAAPLGTIAAGLGLAGLLERARNGVSLPEPGALTDIQIRSIVAGLLVTVPVGNLFFWGNLNILAALDDPSDGLIALVGPFYHFDLLLPLSMFGAAGLLWVGDSLRAFVERRSTARIANVVLALAVVLTLAVGGIAEQSAVSAPLEKSEPYTERYEQAYEPFEDRSFDRALVFVPTPYGDWLNHPFQSLRNDPAPGGNVVYAMDRDAESDFRTLEAYPNRTLYRYTYRGEWRPVFDEFSDPIDATLTPLAVERGDRQRITYRVGRVAGSETATVRLDGPHGAVQYGVERLAGDNLTVKWTVGKGRAEVVDDGLNRYSDQRAVGFENAADLTLTVTFTQAGGSTVTYRQEVAAAETDDGVAVIWPPENRVCRLVADCGNEGTYLPGADDYVAGVSLSQDIETVGRDSALAD
ncbi:DUF7846 domain-containing protein [Halorientalis salina]|uniref:DUF7846 domain-containing protein n=1 Tax=Halorientalis salina TaxID=2932266 RepID=UPI002022AA25|nr:glycosyltransferase family 39 protein [Halorientalis salina]